MRYGGKACSLGYRKREKWRYKNSPFCSFCELYNFGVWLLCGQLWCL